MWRNYSEVIRLSIISVLILLIPVLINIAFLTLMERKVLGLRQSRKGPNKVSSGGVLQPFSDAIKLFSKERALPVIVNAKIFIIGPVSALTLSLLGWCVIPWETQSYDFSLLALLIILGIGLYPLLISGWSSNNSYAIIGALRGVAQTISYEVSLALLLISYFCLVNGLRIEGLINLNFKVAPIVSILVTLWLITGLAETNRTPFDFAEGESELVSGFNIEYSAGGFALIFIAEYGSILLIRFFTAMLIGLGWPYGASRRLTRIRVAFFWIWARATLPRYRYDKLIALAWKSILPATLALLVFFILI